MIGIVGLSHRTAPLAVREQLAIDDAGAKALLGRLVEGNCITEAVVLATCNRVEIIFVSDDDESLESASDYARRLLIQSRDDWEQHVYQYLGKDGIRHLFRVAASLDSLVVGEPQILGQLKTAFERARSNGTVGARLHRAMTRAFKAAKRVRTETAIGAGQVSVASVALDLARQIFDELSGRRVALIGSGEMAETIARLLGQSGANVVVVGRNQERVAALTRQFRAEGYGLTELERVLPSVDVVITSTSAKEAIIDQDMVRRVMRARGTRDLFLLDLAVPRDVDPRVEQLNGVYLYNVDDLSTVTANALSSRTAVVELAERVVEQEVAQFERREEAEQVTPIARALHDRVGGALRREFDKSLRGKLRSLGNNERLAIERMLEASTKKLLHDPVMRLRKIASERPEELATVAELISELFSLAEPRGSLSDGIDRLPAEPAEQHQAPPGEGEDETDESSERSSEVASRGILWGQER